MTGRSDQIRRDLAQCMMTETLPLICRNDLTRISDIQCSPYPSIGWRKITGSVDPMNRKTQTGKIFQYRMIYQSDILCSLDGIMNLYPAQRPGTLPSNQNPLFQLKQSENTTYKKTPQQCGVFSKV